MEAGDISRGIFKFSNLSSFNVMSFLEMIYPPKAAMLIIDMVHKSPEVMGEDIKIGSVVELSVL